MHSDSIDCSDIGDLERPNIKPKATVGGHRKLETRRNGSAFNMKMIVHVGKKRKKCKKNRS